MKKYLTLSSLLFLSFSCLAAITIKGEITAAQEQIVRLGYWKDYKFIEEQLPVDSKGHFGTTIETNIPLYVKLSCTGHPFLLLFPGEDLIIKVNKTEIKLSGSAGKYNQFKMELLNEMTALLKKDKNIDRFQVALNRSDLFFKNFQHPLKNYIHTLNTAFIASSWKLYPFLVENSTNEQKMLEMQRVFKNEMASTDEMDWKRFRELNFRDSILQFDPQYLQDMLNFLRIMRFHTASGDSTSDQFITERNIALETFGSNPFSTSLIAYILNHRLASFDEYPMKLLNAGSFLDEFKQLLESEKFTNVLEAVYEEALKVMPQLTPGAFAPELKGLAINGETIDIKKFRGKVVYIDFWASWCGPCIVQSKLLAKLENQVEDPRFTILSVSIDEDTVQWKKAVSTYSFAGVQINVPALATGKSVLRTYNVHSVPHFVLIGNDGKIVAANTAWPDDPELLKLIRKEIKK